ncbi:MAG: hypothetical protein ACYS8L_11405 [Planctomycetota bacterium]|jgi:hypothetical protein
MSSPFRVTVLFASVVFLAGTWVEADTVVLKDGTRLTGEVAAGRLRVTIRSSTGTLILPAARVGRIERAELFDAVPLADALEHIGELADLDVVLGAEIRADPEPVSLHLTEKPVETVLEFLLEPRGYGYTARPSRILYVGRGPVGGEYVVRVYDVRDLLLSIEDQPGAAAAAGGVAGRDTGGDVAPQFGSGQAGSQLQVGGVPALLGGEGGDSLRARAQNLIYLIQSVCGQGTWQYPVMSANRAGPPAAIAPAEAPRR